MTRLIDAKQEAQIRLLATVGDVHFDEARAYAEQAGFHLVHDGAELQSWCSTAASEGNSDAQHAMAEFLFVGLFGHQDKSGAIDMASSAVRQDHLSAKHLLASLIEADSGNAEYTARALMEDAANRGYLPALRSLAVMHVTGSGASLDSKLGYQYFEQAAESGDAYSQYMLSNMLLELTESKEWERGLQWLFVAAEQSFPAALDRLAKFYSEGLFGFEIDKKQASQLLAKAEKMRLSRELGP